MVLLLLLLLLFTPTQVQAQSPESYSAFGAYIIPMNGVQTLRQHFIESNGQRGLSRQCQLDAQGIILWNTCDGSDGTDPWVQVDLSTLRGVGNEAYAGYGAYQYQKNGVHTLYQEYIDISGTTSYSRNCPIGADNVTWSACDGWQTKALGSMLTSSNVMSGQASLIPTSQIYADVGTYTLREGSTWYLRQLYIESNARYYWSRRCPFTSAGPDMSSCSLWQRNDLDALRRGGAERYRGYGAFRTIEAGTEVLRQLFIADDGMTGYSRVCTIDRNLDPAVQWSTCDQPSDWRTVRLDNLRSSSQFIPSEENFDLTVSSPTHPSLTMPVYSNTTLDFRITTQTRIPQGGFLCVEMPINSRESSYADSALWQPLSSAQLSSSGTGWSQPEIVSNGLEDNGMCVTAQQSIPPGEAVTLRYQGLSQKIARTVRFKAQIYRSRSQTETQQLILASNTVELTPLPTVREVVIALPADIVIDEPFALKAVALDPYGNLNTNYTGSRTFVSDQPISGLPASVSFVDGYAEVSNLLTNTSGFVQVSTQNGVFTSNWAYAQSNPSLKRFFGDLHFHTGWGMPEPFLKIDGDHAGNYSFGDPLAGNNSAIDYARDASLLDFVALTEHVGSSNEGGYVLDDPDYERMYSWNRSKELADLYDRPGIFSTLYGYEWGGEHSPEGGHHIILFNTEVEEIYRSKYITNDAFCNLYDDPSCRHVHTCTPSDQPNGNCYSSREDLFDRLEQDGAVFTAIPHTMSWYDAANPTFDTINNTARRIGELFSFHNHGEHQANEEPPESAWTYQHGWMQGHKIGVIAASDNHTGQPGLDDRYDQHDQDGGKAVLLAADNTRDDLWESIQARNTYATTGPRVYVDFAINDVPMGSEITSGAVNMRVRVGSQEPIETVEVMKHILGTSSFEPVLALANPGETYDAGLEDTNFDADSIYYLRVTLQNGEMAWTSPIWVAYEPTPLAGDLDGDGDVDWLDYQLGHVQTGAGVFGLSRVIAEYGR